MKHGAGIDIGEAMMVRGGVRNNNDLVSIGDPPNIAAKLSELRNHRTYISSRMWDAMSYGVCYSGGEHKPMWSEPRDVKLGDRVVSIRSSDWGSVVS
jgi:class 3 adenylate cyclase